MNCRVFVSALLIWSAIGSAEANDVKREIVWLDYPTGGVVLGQGYDLLEDRPTYGKCVDFVPIQDPSQEVNYRFEEVNSRTELLSNTNISASGALKMALVKATARLSFLSEETFTSNSTKFYFNAEVTNSTLFAAPSLDFKKGAIVPALIGDVTDSLARYMGMSKISIVASDKLNTSKCGQGFVAAIVSGAAIDAFLTMTKNSAQQLADIKGGLEADIGGVFKVSGNFQQRQQAKEFQEKVSISSYQYGGDTVDIAFDVAKLKSSISTLAQKAAQQPKPVRIGIVRYDSLDQAPPPAGYSAQYLADAIASYFLITDVFSSTKGYIDDFLESSATPMKRSPGGRPIFRATVKEIETGSENIKRYVDLNSHAMSSAAELSSILQLCQDELISVNKTITGSDNSEESQRQTRLSEYEGVLGLADLRYSPPKRISLNAVGSTRSDAESRYSKDVDILGAEPPSPRDGRSASTDKARLEKCATNDTKLSADTTTIRSAPIMAARIAAEELSLRPIYWNDVGERYRQNIAKLYELAKLAGTKEIDGPAGEKIIVLTDEAAFQSKVLDQLREFNRIYRAGGMQRTICKLAFEHPLCRMSQEEFAKAAEIGKETASGDNLIEFVDVEQIRVEIDGKK